MPNETDNINGLIDDIGANTSPVPTLSELLDSLGVDTIVPTPVPVPTPAPGGLWSSDSPFNMPSPSIFGVNPISEIQIGDEDDLAEEVVVQVPQPVDQYVETIDDYRIKYEHCYGVLDGKLVMLHEFYREEDEDGDYTDVIMAIYSLYNGNGTSTTETGEAHSITKAIDWTLPSLGAINYKDTVIFISRRHKQSSPSRYRRAFRQDIIHAFEPTCREYHLLDRPTIISNSHIDHTAMLDIFFREYYSPLEALDQVVRLKRLGAAFSPDYYFTLSASTNSFLLWRGDIIVGTYSKANKKFKIITPMFNSELHKYNLPLMEAA